jgi:hypothetical protein
MRSAINQITAARGSNFFLLIDRQAFSACDPLAAEWIGGKRQAVKLTD